jgi:starvation-inducible DNA-binding protein
MTATTKEKIPQILLKTLANVYTLYYASQTAHWNIEGPSFFQLHQLFQESYLDSATSIDEIAERIRQYDVKIPNELVVLLDEKTVTVKENSNYVSQLKSLHESLEKQWNDISVVAEDAEDYATVDMAGKRAGVHGKFAWMLRSLEKESN